MKSLNFSLIAIAGVLSLLTTACSPSKTTWLQTQEEAPIVREDEAGGVSMPIEQNGEMVIVIDNSDSMKDHLVKFHENIPALVSAVADKLPIKLHVAVTEVYDEHQYDDKDFMAKFAGKYIHRGEFIPVKDDQGNAIANKYFVSSDDANWKTQLQNTLKINVLPLDQGGPQYEELLSPIAAIYGFNPPARQDHVTPELLAKMATQHQGFFFGKDSYKIVIFVSDANDGSSITPGQLKEKLVNISGGDESKVMSFGAIVPSASTGCPRDPGNAINPPGKRNLIETYLDKTNPLPKQEDNIFSLCGDYGSALSKFGEAIRKQVLKQKIMLPKGVTPVISQDPARSLRVTYGNTEIPMEDHNHPEIIGYQIIPERNQYSLVLNENLKLDVIPGEQIRLHYTQVTDNQFKNNRTVRYGTQQQPDATKP